MRIAFGLLFSFHGAQKLFGAFGGSQANSGLMWVAGTVEFVGGLAIAVGLLTSLAALLACGQMFIGYFWKHQPNAWFPGAKCDPDCDPMHFSKINIPMTGRCSNLIWLNILEEIEIK